MIPLFSRKFGLKMKVEKRQLTVKTMQTFGKLKIESFRHFVNWQDPVCFCLHNVMGCENWNE